MSTRTGIFGLAFGVATCYKENQKILNSPFPIGSWSIQTETIVNQPQSMFSKPTMTSSNSECNRYTGNRHFPSGNIIFSNINSHQPNNHMNHAMMPWIEGQMLLALEECPLVWETLYTKQKVCTRKQAKLQIWVTISASCNFKKVSTRMPIRSSHTTTRKTLGLSGGNELLAQLTKIWRNGMATISVHVFCFNILWWIKLNAVSYKTWILQSTKTNWKSNNLNVTRVGKWSTIVCRVLENLGSGTDRT